MFLCTVLVNDHAVIILIIVNVCLKLINNSHRNRSREWVFIGDKDLR